MLGAPRQCHAWTRHGERGGITSLHVGNKPLFCEYVARCCHHAARFGAHAVINRLTVHARLISILWVWPRPTGNSRPVVADAGGIALACESRGIHIPYSACFGPSQAPAASGIQVTAGSDPSPARSAPRRSQGRGREAFSRRAGQAPVRGC